MIDSDNVDYDVMLLITMMMWCFAINTGSKNGVRTTATTGAVLSR